MLYPIKLWVRARKLNGRGDIYISNGPTRESRILAATPQIRNFEQSLPPPRIVALDLTASKLHSRYHGLYGWLTAYPTLPQPAVEA